MAIQRGDRLIHRPTGMKCRAVSDEDAQGMVQTKQAGGAFAPAPTSDLDPDNSDVPVKTTSSKEIVARKQPSGGYVAVIKDLLAGTETVGTACPGDPDDFNYNETSDTWSKK